MQRRLGKSLRTIARLSKQAASEQILLEESRRISWRRRLVELLMRGPSTVEELARALPEADDEEILETLEFLVELGIVAREGEQLSVSGPHMNMVRSDLDHRLESLRHFLSAVAHIVYRRFYANDGEAEAFARVFTFAVRPERLPELRERLYETLRAEVFAADGEAENAPADSIQASVVLGVVEVPTDLAWRTPR